MQAKTAKTHRANRRADSTNWRRRLVGIQLLRTGARTGRRKSAALRKTQEWGDRIPIGVFYQERVGTHLPRTLHQRIPFYIEQTTGEAKLVDDDGCSHVDLNQFIDELKTS